MLLEADREVPPRSDTVNDWATAVTTTLEPLAATRVAAFSDSVTADPMLEIPMFAPVVAVNAVLTTNSVLATTEAVNCTLPNGAVHDPQPLMLTTLDPDSEEPTTLNPAVVAAVPTMLRESAEWSPNLTFCAPAVLSVTLLRLMVAALAVPSTPTL